MLSKINSCAVIGLDGERIEVEVDISKGYPCFNIVGLPDKAIDEAKERIRSAIRNTGISFPYNKRLVINLAPADIKKEGPAYDLPMAVGILLVSQNYNFDVSESLFVGELSLEGKLRHTNGILPISIFAKENGFKKLYVPEANANEASLIDDIEIIPIKSLQQLIEHFSGKDILPFQPIEIEKLKSIQNTETDMSFVKGQEHVKRALEIAAAGAHNVLMSGPPGSGKTLLARTLPTILPKMTADEILEVTKIYSIAGSLPHSQPVINERPFRSPHHSSSGVALVGGGRIPKPGEVSLAHRGVLFLDEFPEFPRTVIENLRQPMEDGIVSISRAQGTLTFPARFTLVASQNPCPCGHYSDPEQKCVCTPMQISNYQKKISGPILDRIDLHIEVPRVKFDKLSDDKSGETSLNIRRRVQKTREIQTQRFSSLNISYNSEMRPNEIKNFCRVDEATLGLLKNAVNQMHLSARGYHRILKIARTIADLGNEPNIKMNHVAEALQYRPKIE